MKKLKLIAIGCFLGIGVGIAQPPPPHPGGSGNQGASIPLWSLLVSGVVAFSMMKKLKNK